MGRMGAAAVETVTIVITDLVGSTQLESRVGPVTAEELREEHFGLLREAVSETGGREVKNTGDGLMVAFESAAAAVSCAVSIQQRFERRNRSAGEPLLIKAGVSAGDASTAEGDVFGMPVIEAARLCDRCSAGQILAKELVAHLAAGRGHAFVSVGALELKGLPEPISAVEVKWEPALVTGIALPERLRELPATAYVGRVPERERLTELWAQAREGSLRLALICGEAGVGKTRLSTQLALQAHEEGATVLYGRCDEDLGVPYQPWGQALGHLVKEAPQRVLAAHVERYGGDLARLLGALRDRVPDLPSPRESDPETERYLLYAAVEGLLQGAGEEEPLLLILDDLHWADQPTLSLLRHVVTQSASMAVMVVGTYRDSDLSRDHPLTALLADLHREQGGERMKLLGLDSEDVLALMEALAGQELDEDGRELALEITRETAGNPFFAGELLRHLTESGAIAQGSDGRWGLRSSIADLGLPQSVREVVSRRVERLGEESQQILTMAAVIGRTFDVELIDLLVDSDEEELFDALESAVQASLLVESLERAGRFSFAHALISHALYDTLGTTRRSWLHRRVAEALEELCSDAQGERLVSEFSEAVGSAGGSAAILAYHWREAGSLEKTVHYLLMAAERAGRGGAEAEAVTLYNQTLDLIPEDDADRRRDVQLKRAIAYARFTHALSDVPRARRRLGGEAKQ
jgi:predicted ATPase/class 3 adenylate cyclase